MHSTKHAHNAQHQYKQPKMNGSSLSNDIFITCFKLFHPVSTFYYVGYLYILSERNKILYSTFVTASKSLLRLTHGHHFFLLFVSRKIKIEKWQFTWYQLGRAERANGKMSILLICVSVISMDSVKRIYTVLMSSIPWISSASNLLFQCQKCPHGGMNQNRRQLKMLSLKFCG